MYIRCLLVPYQCVVNIGSVDIPKRKEKWITKYFTRAFFLLPSSGFSFVNILPTEISYAFTFSVFIVSSCAPHTALYGRTQRKLLS